MARTTSLTSKAVTAFFTPEERNEIKAESAALGISFTEYVLAMRKAFKAAPKKGKR